MFNRLCFLLAATASAVPCLSAQETIVASDTTPDTILSGDYAIDGILDVYGDDLSLGTTTVGSSDTNALSITYQDAPVSTITFQATQPGQTWVWQSNGAATPNEQMRLGDNGVLTLTNASGQSLSLDPAMDSIFDGNILVTNGAVKIDTPSSGIPMFDPGM
ncbi:MAG: hypothetical protein AAGH40_10410 [Verrucomicrobiota bacterium]